MSSASNQMDDPHKNGIIVTRINPNLFSLNKFVLCLWILENKMRTYMDEELVANQNHDGHNAHLAQDEHKYSDRVNGRHAENVAQH